MMRRDAVTPRGPAEARAPSPARSTTKRDERATAILQWQRTAGNRAVTRLVSHARPALQRVIAGNLHHLPLNQVATAVHPDGSAPTYDWALQPLIQAIPPVMALIQAYNTNTGVGTANAQLTAILTALRDIESSYIAEVLPLLTRTKDQTAADKATYAALLILRDEWVALMHSVNDEVAGTFNIQRTGSGNRPDVKQAVLKTFESGRLNLSNQEQAWVKTFLQSQGTNAKTVQEALTAVLAKRAGHFLNLTSGKGNPYKKKGTNKEADVEYQTTDPNKPVLWDQKAITVGEGQTSFDGRLDKTYNKAEDAKGTAVPVGLLFDATYADPRNYEIAWAAINEMLLTGAIPATAIKEVRALQPDVFLSDLDVKMTEKIASDDPDRGKKQNIKWVENLKGAQQNGYFTIPRHTLPANRLAQILNATEPSYSRYGNDRSWLPTGVVYDEFGAGIGGSNLDSTSIKFVLSADRQQIYLTATHYKGYSVTSSGGQPQARNPFFKIL